MGTMKSETGIVFDILGYVDWIRFTNATGCGTPTQTVLCSVCQTNYHTKLNFYGLLIAFSSCSGQSL
jgi:hypothetical protein